MKVINPSEFQEFVSQTKAAVLAAIRDTLSPNLSHMIDDVVQETYIQAYQKLVKSHTINNSVNYLYTIAKNESMRLNKKEKRLSKLAAQYADYQAQIQADDFEDTPALFPALQTISPAYQQVIHLLIKGLSLKEISKTLNLKMGTVKSKIHRAKSQIKEVLKEEYHEFQRKY